MARRDTKAEQDATRGAFNRGFVANRIVEDAEVLLRKIAAEGARPEDGFTAQEWLLAGLAMAQGRQVFMSDTGDK